MAESKTLQLQGQVALRILKITSNTEGFYVKKKIKKSEMWRKENTYLKYFKICKTLYCENVHFAMVFLLYVGMAYGCNR